MVAATRFPFLTHPQWARHNGRPFWGFPGVAQRAHMQHSPFGELSKAIIPWSPLWGLTAANACWAPEVLNAAPALALRTAYAPHIAAHICRACQGAAHMFVLRSTPTYLDLEDGLGVLWGLRVDWRGNLGAPWVGMGWEPWGTMGWSGWEPWGTLGDPGGQLGFESPSPLMGSPHASPLLAGTAIVCHPKCA